MQLSTRIYGLDTSVFVRLLTGHPKADFEKTTRALKALYEKDLTTEFVVSNQVIGEAYITLQHFYKIAKEDAKSAILELFDLGNINPVNGGSVLTILREHGGAGLVDRLIVNDYNQRLITVLTNDKRMAKVEGAKLLK